MDSKAKSFYVMSILILLMHLYFNGGSIFHLFQFNIISNFAYFASTVLSISFLIIGIIGIIKFVTQEKYFNKYIKAYAIYHCFYFVLNLPTNLYSIIGKLGGGSGLYNISWRFYLSVTFSLIYFILILRHFPREERRLSFAPHATNGPRFKHYLIDTAFIVIVGLSMRRTYGFMLGGLSANFSTTFFQITLLFTLMTYYLVSEGIFNQSLGKIVTNKYVARANGDAPSFGNIVLRTLCRFIPFEGFSYLPNPMAKWHDKFSNTDVFDLENHEEISTPAFEFQEPVDTDFDPGHWDDD